MKTLTDNDIRPGQLYFAVIASDGVRPVVWGLGASREDAIAEARSDESPADDDDMRVVTVDADRARRINAGDVDASDLWF